MKPPERKFVLFEGHKITAKDGLLWSNKEIIFLPLADIIAVEHGFSCAERLVKFLEEDER